jgi:hypothetical protein
LTIIDSIIWVAVMASLFDCARHADHALLQRRHRRVADFDRQVAARDHDAVGGVEDFLQHGNRFGALDLGDHHRLVAVRLAGDIRQLARHFHVGRALREGNRQVVGLEAGIAVLMSSMSFEVSAGAVRPPPWRLMPLLFDSSPPTFTMVNLVADDLVDDQHDQAVVEQQVVARPHVARQRLVVEADAFLVAQLAVVAPLGVEDERIAVDQFDLAFFELADADLRTLHVGHDRHFAAAFGGGAAHQGGAVDMVLGLAVREVQAHDVDAGADHAHEDVEVGRPGRWWRRSWYHETLIYP